IAVAGRGVAALRRVRALKAGGAGNLLLFTDEPADGGEAVRPLPIRRSDLAGIRALWITGLADGEAAELAALARSERVLVNVEDRPALCDFHSVAEVRRGDLLMTVSTGGASPGLAARIRARLAEEFGSEWAERSAAIRRLRDGWRQERRPPGEIAELTDVVLRANGWLA